MDRMLYISMSGAKQTMQAQSINANNLANVQTHGFRADFQQQRSQQVFGDGLPTRAYAMTESPGFKFESGTLETTARELDVAIKGEGWITVQAEEGSEAFTRAGNLRIIEGGMLVTADGHNVMGDSGPIVIPPSEKIDIAADGTITVLPVGQNPSAMAVVDRIKMVNPPQENLYKDKDGLIRAKDGVVVEPDPNVSLINGALESSNVNPVESLVTMIELSRRFEMQVKMMKTADEASSQTTQMMR
jgi:flagellar basal-body rod protein FlgF